MQQRQADPAPGLPVRVVLDDRPKRANSARHAADVGDPKRPESRFKNSSRPCAKTPISLKNKLRLKISPCRSRAALVKMEGTESRGNSGKILGKRGTLKDEMLRTR